MRQTIVLFKVGNSTWRLCLKDSKLKFIWITIAQLEALYGVILGYIGFLGSDPPLPCHFTVLTWNLNSVSLLRVCATNASSLTLVSVFLLIYTLSSHKTTLVRVNAHLKLWARLTNCPGSYRALVLLVVFTRVLNIRCIILDATHEYDGLKNGQ